MANCTSAAAYQQQDGETKEERQQMYDKKGEI